MKSVCFDVIGTCFDFDPVIDTIASRLSTALATTSTGSSIDPRSLFFAWFYAAQRDFTYLSLAGTYKPIANVLSGTFVRACRIAGVAEHQVSPQDVEAIMTAFKQMPPRAGLKACIDGLRRDDPGAAWDVYAVTNGGVQTSLAYFHRADIALDEAHLLSCDSLQIAKPDTRVYEKAKQHLSARGLGDGDGDRWFVAAHTWDLIAARKAGFKTAWLAFEEFEPVPELFGEFDLCVGGMEELLAKLSAL